MAHNAEMCRRNTRGQDNICRERKRGVFRFTGDPLDIDGQLIITTHNTGLLKSASPRNVFIIDIDAEGYKRISRFSSEIRTAANNNQNRYLNNAVGGVPFIGAVDLRSIAE